jgi:hypothetical protein
MYTSISKARQNLFAMADSAAEGEKVGFIHKGQTFHIVPADLPGKLARIKPIDCLPEGMTFDDFEKSHQEMRQEVIEAWEKNNLS